MNILIVGGTLSHRGGVEQFCERAEQALIHVGGHRVERIQSNTAYLRPRSLGGVWRCVKALFRRRRKDWDCVWFQYVNFPDLVLLLVCRLFGYTILVTPHLGSNWASQSNALLRGLGSKLLAVADGIALISTTQAEELLLPASIRKFQIKTFLPREFPARPGRHHRRAETLALVHAGRLSEGKGSFLFLDVCAALKRNGHDFHARLIGSCDDPTERRIQASLKQADLEDRVTRVAPLPEAELLQALSHADVLVHLSDIDSFPLIVLEAIGCGVFPICKDLPGARLITRTYCGHLVAGSTAVEDVAGFLADITPSELRATAAPAGERLTADYDWARCVAAVEDAVRGVARP